MKQAGTLFVFAVIFVFFLLVGLRFQVSLPQPPEKVVYQTVREYVNRTIEVPVWNISEQSLAVYGIGIFQNTTQGELIRILLTLRGGNGTILLDVSDHAFGADFQETLPLIKTYAEKFTHKAVGFRDILLSTNATAATIEGTSGSAAVTAGLIALLENTTLKNDTIITGVLMADGSIGAVNSLNQKIKAAAKLGVKEIIIPASQCDEAIINTTVTVTCVEDMAEAMQKLEA